MKLRLLATTFVLIAIGFFGIQKADAEFTFETIHYSGPEAIDLIFTGDGFTAAEQASFDTYTDAMYTHLFTGNPPFDTNLNNFNIYKMIAISNESGISVLGGVTVDTAIGTYSNRNGFTRYTGLSEESRATLRNELKKTFKKKVYFMMVLNTPIYGGSGDLNAVDRFMSIANTTTYGPRFRALTTHEFGHAFGDMADEFGGACDETVQPGYWDPVLFNKKNVTYDNVNDRKWDSIVSTPQYFLSANYCNNEWYRSSNTGLMRSLSGTKTHSELGQILVQNRIDEDVAYNTKVESYQVDGMMTLPSETDRNIRIHADESILSSNLVCDNLYVAEDSSLIVRPNVTIDCNSITALGTISYEEATVSPRKKSLGYYIYGCKNTKALNYKRFVAHNPSMCVYEESGQPPPLIDEEEELQDHEH